MQKRFVNFSEFALLVLLTLALSINPASAAESDSRSTALPDTSTEEILVTASPLKKTSGKLAVSNDLLTDEALEEALSTSLGATLDSLPGVHNASYGNFVGQPVIRGLSGGRIKVLSNGLEAFDLSKIGPDHPNLAEALGARQIEVLKGPLALLHGNGAIGGIINVVDNRVPHFLADGPELSIHTVAGSVANERSEIFTLDVGKTIALHLNALQRKTDNYSVGDNALGQSEDEELANSDLEKETATMGLSWIGDAGYVGIAYSATNSLFGLPFHEEHHEEEDDHHDDEEDEDHDEEEEHDEEDERVFSDLEVSRWDLRAEYALDQGWFDEVRLAITGVDYEHDEVEIAEGHEHEGEAPTHFADDSLGGRIELSFRKLAGWNSVASLDWREREYQSSGAEVLISDSLTRDSGAALVIEREFGPLHLDWALRFDRREVTASTFTSSHQSNSFGVSMRYQISGELLLGLAATLAERHPEAEELYANGPHLGSRRFEIGNPNLDSEQARNLELSLRQNWSWSTLELAIYRNAIADYIYASDSADGEEEDGLLVARFDQDDSLFIGAEASLLGEFPLGLNSLDWQLSYDRVRAELADSGINLPRIPADRLILDLGYKTGDWKFSFDIKRVFEQHRTAPLETPTEAHTLLGGSIFYQLPLTRGLLKLQLSGHNLTNADARNHASLIKDEAPLPGRNIQLRLGYNF